MTSARRLLAIFRCMCSKGWHKGYCFRDGFVRGRRGSTSDERPNVDEALVMRDQVEALPGIVYRQDPDLRPGLTGRYVGLWLEKLYTSSQ